MNISIIIACLNENAQLIKTIESIRATAGNGPEIIVIDDCSSTPIALPQPHTVRIVQNKFRCGVGPSRHIGAYHASNDILLFTDSHMRFAPGWYEPVCAHFEPSARWNQLLCGQCLGLSVKCDDITKANGHYNGARLVVSNGAEPPRYRILTAKWINDRPGADCYPISACMGALYAMTKDFYFHIGGLGILREFGGDEELLSIRTIRSGGEILMFKQLRAGHVFREANLPLPYKIELPNVFHNQMAIAHTCCPPDVAESLINQLGADSTMFQARALVKTNWPQIAAEAAHVQNNAFVLPWPDYLKRIDDIDRSS